MTEVCIDTMVARDLEDVVAIEKQSFPSPWSLRAFLSEITDNVYGRYIVARVDGTVVGYAGMWVILDEAHVTTIAVHPEYRRKRIGVRLLAALILRARLAGARRMTLEVRKSNTQAKGLYAKFGFVDRGIRRGYYSDTREDAIIMWKDDLTLPQELEDLTGKEDAGAEGQTDPGKTPGCWTR